MKVLVLYHSVTGNTKKLAEFVAEGVKRVDGIECVLKSVGDVNKEDFKSADGIIAGSPVYFGGMSSELKRIFDKFVGLRSNNFTQDKIGAAFATSGHITGGKETTLMSIIQAMLIYNMIIVGDPKDAGGHYGVACTGEPDENSAAEARLLGARVAGLVKKMKA